jgi:hypothetical protein
MRAARAAAAAVASLAFLAGAAAGCGGSSETVTRTVITDSLPGTTTAPAPPATAPPATAPSPPQTGAVGEDDLPPPDALAGLRSGVARPLGDAQSFVDALYQAGDPVKPSAVARLSASGYAGGILRDQVGQDPARGLALFRTYAVAVLTPWRP